MSCDCQLIIKENDDDDDDDDRFRARGMEQTDRETDWRTLASLNAASLWWRGIKARTANECAPGVFPYLPLGTMYREFALSLFVERQAA